GDAADLGISLTIRPCRPACVTDIVVAAQPFVRTEGLLFHGGQRGLIDVGAFNVPPRCEAGLVEDYRPLGIGDDAVTMADHEATGGLADIDAVVAIGGMAQDPFVFFVEGLHGRPGERDACLQLARVGRQVDVLPRPPRRTLLASPDCVPAREPEIGVPGGMFSALQGVWRDVGLGKVRHRIAAGFKEQQDVLAIGDPASAEAHAHAPTQRLSVQQSLGQRFGHEESADCSRRERTLLPGQSHALPSNRADQPRSQGMDLSNPPSAAVLRKCYAAEKTAVNAIFLAHAPELALALTCLRLWNTR